MFSAEGMIALPDALVEIRLASMRRIDTENDATSERKDLISDDDTDEILWKFIYTSQRAWLVDPQGHCVRVSLAFLVRTMRFHDDDEYLDGLGVVIRRYPRLPLAAWRKINVTMLVALLASLLGCAFMLYVFPIRLGFELSIILLLGFFGISALISVVFTLSHYLGMGDDRHSIPKSALGRTLVFSRGDLHNFLDFTFPKTSPQPIDETADAGSSLRFDTGVPKAESTVADEKDGTRYIVRAWNAGERFTKDDMKAFLTAPSHPKRLSIRGFGRAWDAARTEVPELGKPGRRTDK